MKITGIKLTREGLDEVAPHLRSQLDSLGDVDLRAIYEACTGGRTRNASMLVHFRDHCGAKLVRALWDVECGQKLISFIAYELLERRRLLTGRQSLTRSVQDHVLKLAG